LEKQGLAGATIWRKLAALASLYEYLCDCNAVTHNPATGVNRPSVDNYEGKPPALGDAQARALLDAPPADYDRCGSKLENSPMFRVSY
jgi:integrase/recombinase XerD